MLKWDICFFLSLRVDGVSISLNTGRAFALRENKAARMCRSLCKTVEWSLAMAAGRERETAVQPLHVLSAVTEHFRAALRLSMIYCLTATTMSVYVCMQTCVCTCLRVYVHSYVCVCVCVSESLYVRASTNIYSMAHEIGVNVLQYSILFKYDLLWGAYLRTAVSCLCFHPLYSRSVKPKMNHVCAHVRARLRGFASMSVCLL